MSYLMQRFLKDFILFANFGSSIVIRTRRPVPGKFSYHFKLLILKMSITNVLRF